MKAFLVESILGVFGFDSALKLIERRVFERNPELIASSITRLQQGEITDEVDSAISEMVKKGFSEFVIEEEQLANGIAKKYGVSIHVETPSPAGRLFRSEITTLSDELGFAVSREELVSTFYAVNLLLTRQKIRGAAERRDKLIVQAIEATDDIDKTLNLFASRIREWYGLYFPELDRLVENHQTYSALVTKLGQREEFSHGNIRGVANFSDAVSTEMERLAKSSMGARIAEHDLARIKGFASIMGDLFKLRVEIENYIDDCMKEVAPNLTGLAGSMIGARLLSLAGGLQELSRLPASTIQVLGAEKALFRALRTGANPPKHGIIFQHPLIHRASWWQRGKVARVLAGKLSIASKIDAYSGEYQADELKFSLDKRIEDIRKKYPKPSARKQPVRQERDWGKKDLRRDFRRSGWKRR